MFANEPYYYKHGEKEINWNNVIDILNYPWNINKILLWNYNLYDTQVASIVAKYFQMEEKHNTLLKFILSIIKKN